MSATALGSHRADLTEEWADGFREFVRVLVIGRVRAWGRGDIHAQALAQSVGDLGEDGAARPRTSAESLPPHRPQLSCRYQIRDKNQLLSLNSSAVYTANGRDNRNVGRAHLDSFVFRPMAGRGLPCAFTSSIVECYAGESHLSRVGIRFVDVWESQERFEQFAQEVIGPGMSAAGVNVQPQTSFHKIHNHFATAERSILRESNRPLIRRPSAFLAIYLGNQTRPKGSPLIRVSRSRGEHIKLQG